MTDKPKPRVRKIKGHLVPYGAYDALELSGHKEGQVFVVTSQHGRSRVQNGFYWVGLQIAVDATGAWPNTDKLHDDLKRACGLVTRRYDGLTGQELIEVDSASFKEMDQEKFNEYFKLARPKFIEAHGFDPWES